MSRRTKQKSNKFALIALAIVAVICIGYYASDWNAEDHNLSSTSSIVFTQSTILESSSDTTTVSTTAQLENSNQEETSAIKTTKNQSKAIASTKKTTKKAEQAKSSLSVPAYSGNPYVAIKNNIPEFTKDQYTTKSYETYGSLDNLGRCTMCIACLGRDLMPTGKRGNISSIHPSGWVQARYSIVDSESLYNRCHLIGWQLSGENANERNLITGTRYLNTQGMLPFENMVADYIKETNNHVLYRVTPIFSGKNLVADGVQMEAWSVEDEGDGICYNVYCYNVQPGIFIDYKTGESHLLDGSNSATTKKIVKKTTVANKTTKATSHKVEGNSQKQNYILNTNTSKFHYPNCGSVKQMSEKNKQEVYGTRDDIIEQGYKPCGNCKP